LKGIILSTDLVLIKVSLYLRLLLLSKVEYKSIESGAWKFLSPLRVLIDFEIFKVSSQVSFFIVEINSSFF
jgi:hypothetical protein